MTCRSRQYYKCVVLARDPGNEECMEIAACRAWMQRCLDCVGGAVGRRALSAKTLLVPHPELCDHSCELPFRAISPQPSWLRPVNDAPPCRRLVGHALSSQTLAS